MTQLISVVRWAENFFDEASGPEKVKADLSGQALSRHAD